METFLLRGQICRLVDDDFRIFHLHSTQERFERDLKYELLSEHLRGKKKRLLLSGASPTISNPNVISKKESTSAVSRKRRYSTNTLLQAKKSSVTQTESYMKSSSSETPK